MSKRWMWGVGGAILVFLIAFALDVYPGLRGGAGWDWTYELPQNWGAVAILAAVLIAYLLGAWILHQRAVHRTFVWLLWAFFGAVVITYAVVGVRGDVGFLLFTRTVSPVQTGGITLAVREFTREGVIPAMQRWTQIMDSAYDANLIHFTTSPPGQALVHYGIAQMFDSPTLELAESAAQSISQTLRPYQCSDLSVMTYTRGEIISAGLGLLMPIFAALGVFPLYMAARDLTNTNTPKAAQQISLWWGLVPSLALFAPTWNTVYPALCVLSFALLLRGMLRRRVLWVLLGGVVMSVTTFLNFAVLPILLVFGLFTLGYVIGVRVRAQYLTLLPRSEFTFTLQNALLIGIWYGIGLLSVWVIFALVSGFTPLDLLQITFSSHRDLVQREYLPWLILHPYDTALFMGLPLVALMIVGMIQMATGQVMRGKGEEYQGRIGWARYLLPLHAPLTSLALALGITILVLNISGIVQGENGRILSFYAPFVLLVSLGVLTSPLPLALPHQMERGWGWGLLGTRHSSPPFFLVFMVLQALTLWVMATVLSTIPLDLNPQPIAPRTDVGGFGDTPALIVSDAQFEGTAYAGVFSLASYRYVGDPSAQAITFEFNWRGTAQTERPYSFELIASAFNDIDGQIMVEPFRWQPQNGNYLTPCWKPNDQIRDVVVLRLPPVAEPVVWEVELRAVDERTGDVMRVSRTAATEGRTEAAANGQSLRLEPVKYP